VRAAYRKVLFAAACVAGLAGGVFMGRGQGVGKPAPTAVSGSRLQTSPPPMPGAAGETEVGSTPDTRKLMLRRTLAACETTALWEWLAANPQGDGSIRYEVLSELIDRLGWRAWDHALAEEDPKTREHVAERILWKLAQQDPWKAYAEWQAHRADFENPEWGVQVIAECTLAASATSADKLLEMFQHFPKEEAGEIMVVEFAKDFDFRKVLDQLMTTEMRPNTLVQDLAGTWAERSPQEAAAWLGKHPGYFDEDYHEGEAHAILRAIAQAEMSDESRREALGTLANLSEEARDSAWQRLAEDNDGKVSAAFLHSADLAGRREDYLRQTLLDTRTAEELDESWNLVPLAERRQILAAAEQEWAEKRPTPVDAKSRAHWRQMVTTAWGISP
jgi:hypothetical protein